MTRLKKIEPKIAGLAPFPSENPYPVFRVDKNGIIVYSNPAGQVLLREWNTKVEDYAPERITQVVADAYASDVNREFEEKHKKQTFMFTVAPITREEYVNIYGIDITERKKLEELLRKSRDELEARVKERTSDFLQSNKRPKEEIKERIRTEQSLRLEEARLDALLQLSQIGEATLKEITTFTLEHAIALTKSKIGFVGFLNEDETVYTLHAVSKDVVKECNIAGDPMQWHVVDAGIWADAIREHRTLYVNDYSKPHLGKKGFPLGHQCRIGLIFAVYAVYQFCHFLLEFVEPVLISRFYG
jgi:PAS domain-containing protein